MTDTGDRPLTGDDRALLVHVSRWGSDGYPVRRVGGRCWTWDYRSLSAPERYATKREAVAAFEAYHAVLISSAGAEAKRRALPLTPTRAACLVPACCFGLADPLCAPPVEVRARASGQVIASASVCAGVVH